MENKQIENYFNEGNYFLIHKDPKMWNCTIGDRTINLVLGIQILKCSDMSKEELKKDGEIYDREVYITIIPHIDEISKEMKETCIGDDEIDLCNLEDIVMNYGYGANINLMSINPDQINPKVFIVDDNTILLNKEIDDHDFIREVVYPRVLAVFGLVGFFLDKQNRPFGSNGWDEIEFLCGGEDPFYKFMKKIKNSD